MQKAAKKKSVPKKRGPKTGLSGAAIYSVLSAVIPERYAKKLAGYSDKVHSVPGRTTAPYQVEINDIRQRLQDMPGLVSYLDQILFFANMRDDPNVDKTNRKDAAKEINKMQGYNAPLKVEMEQRVQIAAAVVDLKQIIQTTGINPGAVRQELERRKTIREIEQKESFDSIPSKPPETAQISTKVLEGIHG